MRKLFCLSLLVPALLLALSASAAEPAAGAKGSIKGKVVGADGKPAAGVPVRLMHKGDRKAETKPDAEARKQRKAKGAAPAEKNNSVAETTADASGEFAFSGVAPGKYVVASRMKGVGGGREQVTVTGDGTANATIKLKAQAAKGKGKGKAAKPAA